MLHGTGGTGITCAPGPDCCARVRVCLYRYVQVLSVEELLVRSAMQGDAAASTTTGQQLLDALQKLLHREHALSMAEWAKGAQAQSIQCMHVSCFVFYVLCCQFTFRGSVMLGDECDVRTLRTHCCTAGMHRSRCMLPSSDLSLKAGNGSSSAAAAAGSASASASPSTAASGPSAQCATCGSQLFLGGVECDCCPGRYVCRQHDYTLCSCKPSKQRLMFRHTLGELQQVRGACRPCVICHGSVDGRPGRPSASTWPSSV